MGHELAVERLAPSIIVDHCWKSWGQETSSTDPRRHSCIQGSRKPARWSAEWMRTIMAAPFLTGILVAIIDQRGAASTTWLVRRAERQCILRIGGGVDKTADVVECAL
jgi:hypothetical protein